MARTGLRVLLCALAAAALVGLPAAGGDDPERRQTNLLAVQVALEKGQEFLQRGDYAAAVAVLEKQIPYIDGNRRYLACLIRLNSADRDQRIAASGQRIRNEVLQFARLIAAECEPAVAILALGEQLNLAAQMGAQSRERLDRCYAEGQGIASEFV